MIPETILNRYKRAVIDYMITGFMTSTKTERKANLTSSLDFDDDIEMALKNTLYNLTGYPKIKRERSAFISIFPEKEQNYSQKMEIIFKF
ncbi:MAG: hypothetical protein GY760_12090 [Deltaproteobacteria bacterium]|nr:hypothetical protein [Deltaproteobacteria bacterium]